MPFSPQSIEHTESRINTMRLQAAAPELLEALQHILAANLTIEQRAIVCKAIAKATGE